MSRPTKVEGPKPLADVLEPAFEHFALTHPWLRAGDFEPKSIVRDMLEQAMGFTQFVGYYGLARAEGSLLRYLTDVYRALTHNVPADRRGEELQEIIGWLGETVARTDSSLIDEWRTLQGLSPTETDFAELPDLERRFSENTKAFTAEIRNNPNLKDLHVILHTSLSGVFNQAMVQKVGANNFIAKFQPDELAKAVQGAL